MADAAIIEADYTEWRMVKTRSSLQLIFEVPLEMQQHVMQALGVPLPNVSTPVAICRLVPAAERETRQIVQGTQEPFEADPPRPPKPLSQLAAMTCNEGGFHRFLAEKGDYQVKDAADAATYVRLICGVKSRAEFDTNVHAAAKWRDLKAEYEAWKMDAVAA